MTKIHPIFEQALAPFLKPIATRNGPVECERCAEFDEVHDQRCPMHPDHDPTPFCSGCGAMRKAACHCGPLADNE